MGQVFLLAIKESAEDAAQTIHALNNLHQQNTQIIEKMGCAAKTAQILFAYLEQNPIIDIKKTAGGCLFMKPIYTKQ